MRGQPPVAREPPGGFKVVPLELIGLAHVTNLPASGVSQPDRVSERYHLLAEDLHGGLTRLAHPKAVSEQEQPTWFNDLNQRTAVRAALATDPERNALPGGQDLIVAQESEIMIPAPFMRPLGSRDYGTGNVYEMRTYTYAPGDLPKVLEAWAKAVPAREELSPLAACWTSELGGLNKFVHTWVYKDLAERDRVRAASRAPGRNWPPQSGVRPIRQENKLLIPAAFSPVR